MTEIKWIQIQDRLPENFVTVITLHFNGDVRLNSIQGRHVRKADGANIEVYQWAEDNLGVSHWLDGADIPEIPEDVRKDIEERRV